MPAHSSPNVGPAKPSIRASSGSSPIAHIMSRKLSPAACTSISTWPGLDGWGARTPNPARRAPRYGRSLRSHVDGLAQRGGRPGAGEAHGARAVSRRSRSRPLRLPARRRSARARSPGVGSARKIHQANRQPRHLVDEHAGKAPEGTADRTMLWCARRGLLRVAGDDPEHGMALGGACRDPGQCGDLLRYLLDQVAVARFFGEEKNNLPAFRRQRWLPSAARCGESSGDRASVPGGLPRPGVSCRAAGKRHPRR